MRTAEQLNLLNAIGDTMDEMRELYSIQHRTPLNTDQVSKLQKLQNKLDDLVANYLKL